MKYANSPSAFQCMNSSKYDFKTLTIQYLPDFLLNTSEIYLENRKSTITTQEFIIAHF